MTRKTRPTRKVTRNADVTDVVGKPVAPTTADADAANAPAALPTDAIVEEFKKTDVDSLRVLIDELAGATNASITCYRIIKNQPQRYMFKCTPAEFSLDHLREKHGGGDFRLFVVADGRMVRNVLVAIEPKAMPEGGASLDVAGILRDGFAQQMTIMRELRPTAPPPANNTDLPALITAIGTVLTPVLTALLKPAPPPPPAPRDSGGSIEMFIKGVELARDLGGSGGEGEGGMMGLLQSFLKSPMLAQAAQSYLTHATAHPPATHHPGPPAAVRPASLPRPAAPPQPAHVAGSPAVPGGAPHANPLPPDDGGAVSSLDPRVAMFRAQGYPYLLMRAREGADPALYADWIEDNVPNDLLVEMLSREPDPVTALLAEYPPFNEVREWVQQLVWLLLNPNPEGGDDEGGGDPPAIGPAGSIDGANGAAVQSAPVSAHSPPADAPRPATPRAPRKPPGS